MSFLYPTFLFALILVVIPIVIHLFNFRKYKTIYFSNVAFLKNIDEEKHAASKLKNLLVLITRLLFLIFLVLAFAQPYIPSNIHVATNNTLVNVFVDNSFSMGVINKNGTLLDNAKKKAKEIAGHYGNSTEFQLLTNDFESKHQRPVNKSEFLKLLDEIKISSSTKTIAQIHARQKELLLNAASNDNNISKVAYILSDFQKNNCDFSALSNEKEIMLFFIPLSSPEQNNVYIDSCWFESPVHRFNQPEKLHVRIKNNSNQDIENSPLKLYIQNGVKSPATFSCKKQDASEVIFTYVVKETPGNNSPNNATTQHCKIELQDSPITFDNSFFISYDVLKKIRILCIDSKNSTTSNNYLKKLYSTDSAFEFDNVSENNINYATLNSYNLIILNNLNSLPSGLTQELEKFMNSGGNLLVFPGEAIQLETYNRFLLDNGNCYFKDLDTSKTKIEKINFEHPVYLDAFDKNIKTAQNIDFPVVNNHYPLVQNSKSSATFLLKLQNDDAFLNEYTVKKGRLYLAASTLNKTSGGFQGHALFVPTLFNIGLFCQKSQPLYYTIGNNENIECVAPQSDENILHIKNLSGNVDFIPEQKNDGGINYLIEHHQIKDADNYVICSNTSTLTGVAYNYNRIESDLNCLNGEELTALIASYNIKNVSVIESENKQINEQLQEINQGQKLWKICITLALLFLAIEALLLRFLK